MICFYHIGLTKAGMSNKTCLWHFYTGHGSKHLVHHYSSNDCCVLLQQASICRCMLVCLQNVSPPFLLEDNGLHRNGYGNVVAIGPMALSYLVLGPHCSLCVWAIAQCCMWERVRAVHVGKYVCQLIGLDGTTSPSDQESHDPWPWLALCACQILPLADFRSVNVSALVYQEDQTSPVDGTYGGGEVL